jgi:hypothetical protein
MNGDKEWLNIPLLCQLELRPELIADGRIRTGNLRLEM